MRRQEPPRNKHLLLSLFKLLTHSFEVILTINIESTLTTILPHLGETVVSVCLWALISNKCLPQKINKKQKLVNILRIDLKDAMTWIYDQTKSISSFYLPVDNWKWLVEKEHLPHFKRILIVSVKYTLICYCKKFMSPAHKVVHDTEKVWLSMPSSSFLHERPLKKCFYLFFINKKLLLS